MFLVNFKDAKQSASGMRLREVDYASFLL